MRTFLSSRLSRIGPRPGCELKSGSERKHTKSAADSMQREHLELRHWTERSRSRVASRRAQSMRLTAICCSITLLDQQITGGVICNLACLFESLLGRTLCSWQGSQFLRAKFPLVQLSSMEFVQQVLCFGRRRCREDVSKMA